MNKSGKYLVWTVLSVMGAFAEFERNLILERSAAGRIAARARGRLGGRPEKLTDSDLKLLKLHIKYFILEANNWICDDYSDYYNPSFNLEFSTSILIGYLM